WCSSYPDTGYSYNYSLNLPSNPYLPKIMVELGLRYNPTYGRQVRYLPGSRFLYDDIFGTYWPLRTRRYYPLLLALAIYDLWPTEHLRKIRVRNNLYSLSVA
ncbi:hypothetical protein NQ317_004062, partial [Molorchus minor]